MEWETVIGLEVHTQLLTKSKLFSGASTEFGALPNSQACLVDLGYPGLLPVLNKEAVRMAVKLGLAIGATVAPHSVFARKNYFYPDLPKGYQISQYELPVVAKGHLDIELDDGSVKRIGITRAHLEEDAGKLIHEEKGTRSFVDLNRTGVPLVEIVTEPDMRSADEAYQYMNSLRTILQYAGVSDCDMEKGELRCDVNLSIRPRSQERFGTKTEIKNLNSFKNAKAALEYEHARQIRVLEAGEKIVQSTLLWDAENNRTRLMRSKEEAHDYRYFPEPDLPPVTVSLDWIERVRAQIPELPAAKRVRFQEQYQLSDYDAKVLSFDRAMADFFEEAARASGKPKPVANWLVNELNKILNEKKIEMSAVRTTPSALVELIGLVESGRLTGASAKEVFAEIVQTGSAPSEVVRSRGLEKIADSGAIESAAKAAIAANPKAVADYRSGKEAALKSLIGGVMKQTKGQADPKLAEEALRKLLS